MGNYQNTRHHKGPRELVTGGEWIYGRNPVIEALRAGMPMKQVLMADNVKRDPLIADILRKQSGEKQLNVSYEPKGDKYVVCTVDMPHLHLTEAEAAALFTPAGVENIPYLLCRQIVRDHGEATNRRGCAIRAEDKKIIIALPRKA